ncbi:MAG: M13 family metallopeptidase [Planctomycetes bacterium]|nr:M13 family metallopeptidase [Planctomycetota bacterium]
MPAENSPKIIETNLKSVGLDPEAIDRSVSPCEDFYAFACGGWIAKNEIPADRSRWGQFNVVHERNQITLKQILETAMAAEKTDPEIRQIADYYAACMDEAAVEEAGYAAIKPLLALAKKVRNFKTLATAITELHRHQIWPVFYIRPEQDHKNATQMIAKLDQDGLGLPDRDYYVKEDEKSKEIRKKYTSHVKNMMKLLGFSSAKSKKAAADVMRIETEIAKISMTGVERRDIPNTYNKIDRKGLAETVPSFLWDDYFKGLGLPEVQDITVTSVKFFKGVEKLLKTVKPRKWRNYLQWQIVHDLATTLPKAFDDEDLVLVRAITGQQVRQPRWKRCIDATDMALGEALGKPYVKAMFAGKSKERAEHMVRDISGAFTQLVERIEWMSEATKKRAIEKRDAMVNLVGYPSKWRTYKFSIDKKTYAANSLAAREFLLAFDLAKIGKPIDRMDWHMSPQTVNAGYSFELNNMLFPAGILQPVFYHADAHLPVNYGAIGIVIAHELTHGFDDQGSKFAADGNLTDWWTKEDAERFKAKSKCVIEQYAKYEPLPGLNLNGELTLGENIADMGGVKLAFAAYREARKDAPERIVADGFTEDQQFFLATGQILCSKRREELTRLRAQIDPHSPPKFRINGPLSNLEAFGEAFSCQKGSAMRPAKTCEVW